MGENIKSEILLINDKVRDFLISEYVAEMQEFSTRVNNVSLEEKSQVADLMTYSINLIKSEDFSCLTYYKDIYAEIDKILDNLVKLEGLVEEKPEIKEVIKAYNEYKLHIDKIGKAILQKINMEIARINKMEMMQEEAMQQEDADNILGDLDDLD
ncbi:MAG: hypothetical protein N4A38_02720 [Candidatus Gracilibacteria bacterium]|nr:hypothetical protein [Candidatus Gracilibacteria bacterium]